MEDFLKEYNIPLITASVCLFAGLVLSIFGAKLIKTGSAISGLLMGGFSGWAVVLRTLEDPTYVLVGVGVGALLGCLVTWLLFRVWMGISCMVILAMVVPLSLMAVQNKDMGLGQLSSSGERAGVERQNSARPRPNAADWVMRQALRGGSEGGGGQGILQATGREAKVKMTETASWIKTFAMGQWERLTEVEKTRIGLASVIGGGLGLLVGLMLPKVAAAIQSGIIGAVLILMGSYSLLNIYDPQRAVELTRTPSRVFIALSVISGLGILFQWTFMKKKTDS